MTFARDGARRGERAMRGRVVIEFVVTVALTLTVALAGAGPAAAQDARLEAARKEGKVVWYTSLALTSAEKVAKLFEAAYPGIKVEVHRTGSQRILQRVMQELQANIKAADVIHTSDAGHFVLLKDKKLLMKYTPAGVDGFPAGFKDKDGYHYGLRATVNAIAYNTKIVSAAEAPKTWKDLLDPKWQRQARHRASGLQRRDRHPRPRPRPSVRVGLLQAARPEQAHARPVGGGSVGRGGLGRAAGGGQRRRLHVLPDEEEGQSGRDRVPEGGRAARGVAHRDRRLRPASERGQALHRLHVLARGRSRCSPTPRGSTPGIRR